VIYKHELTLSLGRTDWGEREGNESDILYMSGWLVFHMPFNKLSIRGRIAHACASRVCANIPGPIAALQATKVGY
jgi:hypothetical protein